MSSTYDIEAAQWLHTFCRIHVFELTTLGFHWLYHAQKHLEARIDRELRAPR